MTETPEPLKAKESKCWNCRFGMCISERQQQTLIHQGTTQLEGEEDDPFNMGFDTDMDSEMMPMHAHQVEARRSGAICHWASKTIDPRQPPVRVEFVSECSRFEARVVVE